MAFPEPSPPNERALAERLLAALKNDDTVLRKQLEEIIFGLHFPVLRLYVDGKLRGAAAADLEEVFAAAASKMFRALGRPEKVRKVLERGSFAGLFTRIAKDEISEYWRGRPPYGRRDRASLQLDSGIEDRHATDPHEQVVRDGQAAAIARAVDRLESFDVLLIELTADAGIPPRLVERLLVLAEATDADGAASEAAELLDLAEAPAAAILAQIRDCPAARPLTRNALKMKTLRVRRKVQRRLEEEGWGPGQ